MTVDIKKAETLIQAAQREIRFALSTPIIDDSRATIVRNIYEAFRMLGEALLTSKGIKSSDHIETIKEIINLSIDTSRPIAIIDSLRTLRHNINYNGYFPTIAEVNYSLDIANALFEPIVSEIKKIIRERGGTGSLP